MLSPVNQSFKLDHCTNFGRSADSDRGFFLNTRLTMHTELRKLPAVDKLLQEARLQELADLHGHQVVLEAIRVELAVARQHIIAGQPAQSPHDLARAVVERVSIETQPSLQPVINATGVIIHTNLGRALLSERAKSAMIQAASAYSNLEYNLEAGQRGY